ncbi:hypothetical protein LCGC14_0890550, partial [marine sediment metagenome]
MVLKNPFLDEAKSQIKRLDEQTWLRRYGSLFRSIGEAERAFNVGSVELPSIPQPTIDIDRQVQDLVSQGRTPITEQTLRGFGATDFDIDEFFAEEAVLPQIERRLDLLGGEAVLTERGLVPRTPEAAEQARLQIQSVVSTLLPTATGSIEQDFPALQQYAAENTEAFLEDLLTIGRTPATEMLLFGIAPEITSQDLDELFGEPLGQIRPQLAYPAPYPIPKTVEEREANLQVFKEYRKQGGKLSADQWRREAALREAEITGELQEDVFRKLAGLPITAEAKQMRVEFAEKHPLAAQFLAGMGDVLGTAGSAMQWLGAEELGKHFSELAEPVSEGTPPPEMPELSWKSAGDPQFWSTLPEFIARNAPFTLALVPAMIVGYAGGSAVAGAIGLSALWTTVLGAIGATTLSRPLEGVLEAAGARDEALARGMTPEQADQVGQEVFLKNLTLSGWDAAQLATAFLPTPAKVLANPFLRAAMVGGKVVVTGLTEAGEEALQEVFQKQALGDPIVLDENMKLAMLLGGVMGAGMGATGAAFTTIIDRTVQTMPADMKSKFNIDMAEGIENGLTEQQAILVALDEVAKTAEGKKLVEEVVQQVQKEDARMQIEASKERQEKIAPMTRQEEEILKDEITKLRRDLLTVPAEERAAIQRRIEQNEIFLEEGKTLIVPEPVEAVGEVKLPEVTKLETITPKTSKAKIDLGIGGMPDSFRISTPEGAKVIGNVRNAAFANKPVSPTRGELFMAEVPAGIQRQGIGTRLSIDALRLMQKNGITTVKMFATTESGKAVLARLIREGDISEPIARSEAGATEHTILLGKKPEAIPKPPVVEGVKEAVSPIVEEDKPVVGELPTAINKVRAEHVEIKSDIQSIRASLRGKRDIESRLTNRVLIGTERELTIAESLLSRVETQEELASERITQLQERLKASIRLAKAKTEV